MNPAETSRREKLESALGYAFLNQLLLDEALTHRSFLNESGDKSVKDNERLEFFGDAVLDFLISELLLDRFPMSREGELTKMRASLVDEEGLALMAQRIDLGSFLRLGRGEEKSGGREKKSILANAYEALLAAVYLDGGISPVRRLVQVQIDYLLDNRGAGIKVRDCKTEFQELVQSAHGTTPRYELRETSGPDHARMFTVAVFVGEECAGEGSGRSKKEAEQEAARSGLSRFKADSRG